MSREDVAKWHAESLLEEAQNILDCIHEGDYDHACGATIGVGITLSRLSQVLEDIMDE